MSVRRVPEGRTQTNKQTLHFLISQQGSKSNLPIYPGSGIAALQWIRVLVLLRKDIGSVDVALVSDSACPALYQFAVESSPGGPMGGHCQPPFLVTGPEQGPESHYRKMIKSEIMDHIDMAVVHTGT